MGDAEPKEVTGITRNESPRKRQARANARSKRLIVSKEMASIPRKITFGYEGGMVACPFCALVQAYSLPGNELACFFEDKYPVTLGHTLVITRRHIESYFDATEPEKRAIWQLVDLVKVALDQSRKPAGYNLGVNVGATAGQTVMHLHAHVIPRYEGDMVDPRGGVRHVIPEKGKYTP
jgi:diadenosine tetraphosphate (Ap4A) HIT family hydrolase